VLKESGEFGDMVSVENKIDKIGRPFLPNYETEAPLGIRLAKLDLSICCNTSFVVDAAAVLAPEQEVGWALNVLLVSHLTSLPVAIYFVGRHGAIKPAGKVRCNMWD